MDQITSLPLANWQNFYVIAGSSSGSLTGLQFIVLTLIAQAKANASMSEIRAFGTPTIVHFCTALLISALATAPWQSTVNFGFCLGAVGLLGAFYSVSIFWHARKATYNPDFEDWIWYTALPLIAHLTLVAVAIVARNGSQWPLFLVAGDTLLFLLLGIHNSWDTITYIVVEHAHNPSAAVDQASN